MSKRLYNLIIVDDEESIRRGLSKLELWQEIGFKIIAVYEDGEDAIEHLREDSDIDVILSDIVMSNSTGLDILRYIKQNGLNIKTVFLSGYSEFKIAQEAIRLGLNEYLLKPTVISDLKKALVKIKTQLDEEEQISDTKQSHKKEIEKILLHLLYNPQKIDVGNLCEIIGLRDSSDPYYWSSISIKTFGISAEVNSEVEELIKNYFILEDDWIIMTSSNENIINALLLVPRDMSFSDCEEIIKEKTLNSLEALKNLFKYKTEIVNIHVAKDIKEIEQILYKDIKRHTDSEKTFKDKTDEDLLKAIKKYDYEKLNEFLLKAKRNTNISVNTLIRIATMLFFQTEHYCIKVDKKITENMYRSLTESTDTEHLIEYCCNAMEAMKKLLNERKDIIYQICRYIDNNVNNQISLKKVAAEFNYNQSYLSRIFKEAMGESFSSYVKKVKISSAKAMLCNPKIKIYEISQELGYSDVRHFYKIFKDYEKITPSQYRNKIDMDIL